MIFTLIIWYLSIGVLINLLFFGITELMIKRYSKKPRPSISEYVRVQLQEHAQGYAGFATALLVVYMILIWPKLLTKILLS